MCINNSFQIWDDNLATEAENLTVLCGNNDEIYSSYLINYGVLHLDFTIQREFFNLDLKTLLSDIYATSTYVLSPHNWTCLEKKIQKLPTEKIYLEKCSQIKQVS